MPSCARLSYRSVNYQPPNGPRQLVSGRPFHSTPHGVDVAEAQSVTQVLPGMSHRPPISGSADLIVRKVEPALRAFGRVREGGRAVRAVEAEVGSHAPLHRY